MALITDPSDLNDLTEITITVATKKVKLIRAGNLSADGVTLKAVYSKLKELWKSDTTYIKYPFPLLPITDEQFELINGWDWDATGSGNDYTPNLIRTGGWALKDSGGVSQEEWAGIITLGTLGGTDQVYYQQAGAGAATNVVNQGAVNQAVKVYGDAGHGNFDYRAYFKLFVREYQKTYGASSLSDIGVTTMTYQVYRFPLTDASDAVKITHNDAAVIGNTPYFGTATLTLTDGSVTVDDATLTSATGGFVAGDVGKYVCIDAGSNAGIYKVVTFTDTNNVEVDRVFPATQASISFTVNPIGMGITWYGAPQARVIGGVSRDFHVIIDGNQGTAEEIYEFVQFMLRRNHDIDEGAGTKTGKVTNELLAFVGDTLKTKADSTGGTFIDDFQTSDTNRLVFVDDTSTERTYPYVATLTLQFGDNLQNDTVAKYWVYFSNDDAGDNSGDDYGTSTAILVNQNESYTTSTRAIGAGGAAMIGTASAHGLAIGDGVYISGFTSTGSTGLNGNWIVATTTDATHFTFGTTMSTAAEVSDTGALVYPTMVGNVSTAASVQLSFDYDGNSQRGAGSTGQDAPITVVAIGLGTAQFVKATGTVARSVSNSVSLVASLERNYSNP